MPKIVPKPVPVPTAPKDETPRCPVCNHITCYHCWECKRDLSTGDHRPECSEYKTDAEQCKACLGSGLDSKGRPCHPCEAKGRPVASERRMLKGRTWGVKK